LVEEFRAFITSNPGCFERANKGHITGSAWIVDTSGSQALLTHHRKLKKWLQVGGHADGDNDSARVALKEAQEETGIVDLEFATPSIFDISIHPIPSDCTFHYDIRYLLRAPANASYVVSEESLDLAWVESSAIVEDAYLPSLIRMNTKFQTYFNSP
jgi:8-oxo-dGTP pyrophosphatase MutT (NUDIX family)